MPFIAMLAAGAFRDVGNSAEPIPQGRLLLYAHGTCDLIYLEFVKIPRSPLNLMYKILDTSTREKRGSANGTKKPGKQCSNSRQPHI